jgi:glutathione synthase
MRIALVMDPIGSIKIAKDTSFALALEAQRRGHALDYVLPGSLAVAAARPVAQCAALTVRDDPADWFTLGASDERALGEYDAILMRRDPPVDQDYLHDTQILSLAAAEGALVVNDPAALRDFNEKLAALMFPQCCPPTCVARDAGSLRRFVEAEGEVVLKPLDGMGGRSIFRSRRGDPNLNVILETLTEGGRRLALAQRFLPEIAQGDKRILLVDGEPVEYALARIPQGEDFRGNLAAGGRGVGQALGERDRWIAGQVGPELRRRGLVLVGLDVIGDWLTEVNVTSPTCARELDAQFGLNIAGRVFDAVEARWQRQRRS